MITKNELKTLRLKIIDAQYRLNLAVANMQAAYESYGNELDGIRVFIEKAIDYDMSDVKGLLAEGKKIEAIFVYRRFINPTSTLKAAKEFVESIMCEYTEP